MVAFFSTNFAKFTKILFYIKKCSTFLHKKMFCLSGHNLPRLIELTLRTHLYGFQPLTIITKRSILDVAAVLDPSLNVHAHFQCTNDWEWKNHANKNLKDTCHDIEIWQGRRISSLFLELVTNAKLLANLFLA